MQYEKPMLHSCHSSCAYRKFIRGKGMKYMNDESGVDMLNVKYNNCPLPIDYFRHMDTFYAVLRTERGLVGLAIISGEPLMVEPALKAYAAWLRKRRRSVAIWTPPVNMADEDDDKTVTDFIYAEFILGNAASNYIMHLAEETYPAFQQTLPADIRELSEKAIAMIEDYSKTYRQNSFSSEKDQSRAIMALLDAEKEAMHKAHKAARDGRISRSDYMRVRNRFDDWE